MPSGSSPGPPLMPRRSEEHTSELQSRCNLVCRLLLEKKFTREPERRVLGIVPLLLNYGLCAGNHPHVLSSSDHAAAGSHPIYSVTDEQLLSLGPLILP